MINLKDGLNISVSLHENFSFEAALRENNLSNRKLLTYFYTLDPTTNECTSKQTFLLSSFESDFFLHEESLMQSLFDSTRLTRKELIICYEELRKIQNTPFETFSFERFVRYEDGYRLQFSLDKLVIVLHLTLDKQLSDIGSWSEYDEKALCLLSKDVIDEHFSFLKELVSWFLMKSPHRVKYLFI